MVAGCDPFLRPWHMHNIKESRAIEGTNGAYGLHTHILVHNAAIEILEYAGRGEQMPTAIIDRPCKEPKTLPNKKSPLHESSGCNTCRQRYMYAKKVIRREAAMPILCDNLRLQEVNSECFNPACSVAHCTTFQHPPMSCGEPSAAYMKSIARSFRCTRSSTSCQSYFASELTWGPPRPDVSTICSVPSLPTNNGYFCSYRRRGTGTRSMQEAYQQQSQYSITLANQGSYKISFPHLGELFSSKYACPMHQERADSLTTCAEPLALGSSLGPAYAYAHDGRMKTMGRHLLHSNPLGMVALELHF